MCRDLLDSEPGVASCEIYGSRGEPQEGVDLLAPQKDSPGIEVGQCKCHRDFPPREIRKASDEFLRHLDVWRSRNVRRFILFVASNLGKVQRQREILTQRARFHAQGIAYEVWSADKIRNKLRPHPGIVATYCKPEAHWLLEICGQGAVEKQLGLWNMPQGINPCFVGREDLLREIRTNFTSRGFRIQALSGLGGIGKTQTALHFVYRYSSDYDSVFWLSAENEASLNADIGRIAKVLAHQTTEQGQVEEEGFNQWLAEHREWLLIIDSADDLTLLEKKLPSSDRGDILITSRLRNLQRLGVQRTIVLDTLPQEASEEFLERRIEVSSLGTEEAKTLGSLAHEIGGLPLALEQAGAFIKNTGCSFADYLEAYRQNGIELLERARPELGKYELSVLATLSVSLRAIQDKWPASVDALRLAAFVVSWEGPVPLMLLSEASQHLGFPITGPAAFEPLSADEVLAPLLDYSLVTRVQGAPSFEFFHTLVKAVTLDLLNSEDKRLWARRAISVASLSLSLRGSQYLWQQFDTDQSELKDPALLASNAAYQYAFSPDSFRPVPKVSVFDDGYKQEGLVCNCAVLNPGKQLAFFLDTELNLLEEAGGEGALDHSSFSASIDEVPLNRTSTEAAESKPPSQRVAVRMILVANPRKKVAVVHVRYLTETGLPLHQHLDFVPGQTLMLFDPLNYRIPGTLSNVRNRFLGPDTGLLTPIIARTWRTGRFLILVALVPHLGMLPVAIRKWIETEIEKKNSHVRRKRPVEGLSDGPRIEPHMDTIVDFRGLQPYELSYHSQGMFIEL